MARRVRATIIGLLALMALSVPAMARRLTTTQIRENTIRINALELQTELPEEEEVIIEEEVIVDEGDDNDVVVLGVRDLNFDFDKDVVKPEYYGIVTEAKNYIEQTNSNVIIVGHTDSVGSDAYNNKLSLRRATSVKNKLIEFGLDPSRIIGVYGEGERNPIAPNDTPEGRALNRRTEFKLERR